MISKNDVIDFFNHCAPTWNDEIIRHEEVIEKILDNAGIRPGITVLDVACGTGVLFGDYLKRGVRSVTGVDISPEMAKRAAGKYPESPIMVLCGDIEEMQFDSKFDAVMVYNALPHFPNPRRLVQILAGLTREGGTLTIAHGMSRCRINSHHKGTAARVSKGLMHENELKKIFSSYFDVNIAVSNDEMFQISGIRNNTD